MNKEEFKASILEQINNPKSAIHLYLHPDSAERQTSKSGPTLITASAKKYVFCSEFDLRIDITCSIDEEREIKYQVTFSEMVDTIQRDKLEKYKDISKLKDDSIIYYKEAVDLGLCTFIFCLKPYRLTIKDYVFSAVEAFNDIVLEADISSKKFLTFDTNVSKYLWNTMKNDGGDIRYVHYLFTKHECSELVQFLHRQNVAVDEIDVIKNIFSNILYHEDSSGLGHLVRELGKQLGYTIS